MAGRKVKKGGGTVAPDDGPDTGPEKLRADKWLCYARFFKTRGLAAEMITKGRLRINGQKQPKPGHALAVGDVLTFVMARQTRVVRVLDMAERRGPPSEAQALYLDLDPQDGPATPSPLD